MNTFGPSLLLGLCNIMSENQATHTTVITPHNHKHAQLHDQTLTVYHTSHYHHHCITIHTWGEGKQVILGQQQPMI